MARKRRRRRLKVGVILWPLVVLSAVGGLLFSPVTAANHVRVFGAKTSDKERIAKELQWLKNKPCVTVNGASVEDQLLRRPDVRNVELSRSLLGSAQVTMEYYQPVALVKDTKDEVLTQDGFLCRMPDAPTDLPTIEIFPEAAGPSFGLSTVWEPKNVAETCERAFKQGIIKNLSITVTRNGSVCLNSGVTGRVVLGAPEELDEKFDEIRQILSSHPDLLAQGKELVLIAPKKPVTRPLQGTPL